jgi:glycosyltransferase involved in cell wall biosynthesis
MRVAFSLPAIHDKPDRFRMLCTLSGRVDRLVVLTDDLPESLQDTVVNFPKLEVVTFPRKGFRRHVARWLNVRIEAQEFDVIHDAFGQLASVFQAWGPVEHRPYRLLTTLYTNNWGWFERVREPSMDFGFSYVAQRILTLWSERRICRVADRVLVLGPGLDTDIAEAHSTDPARISCVASEVDSATFEFGPAPEDTVPTLLFTGAVCRNKGIDVLLNGLSMMSEQSFRLKLIGRVLRWEKEWFRDALLSSGLTDRIEHVEQTPHREMPSHYHGARLFVFPSRFEGSPRSVREALASGIPGVVSDIPGHRALDPNHRFLHIVPTFKPEDWARHIDSALKESTEQYTNRSKAGRAHMVSHHSFDAVARQLEQVYAEVLALPPSRLT